MKDVAEHAGVSTATVSRALSNPEKLSFNTRLRVEEAVMACGYSIANQSSSSEARIILVVLNQTDNTIDNEIIEGIKEAVSEHNYLLFITYAVEQQTELDSYNLYYLAISRQICGIIQIGETADSGWLKKYSIETLPKIVIGRCDYSPNSVNIDVDRLTAAFTAVNYLCQSGYSRIAFIAGVSDNGIPNYQEQGYRQALKRWKIAHEKSYIIHGDASFAHGQQAINQLMSLPVPPNAVYCQHDIIAIGAIHQAKRLKLNIPRHLSIMGFGNLELGKYYDPPLTTVTYQKKFLGKQSVNALHKWLQNPVLRPESYLLESEIIERETTIKRQY